MFLVALLMMRLPSRRVDDAAQPSTARSYRAALWDLYGDFLAEMSHHYFFHALLESRELRQSVRLPFLCRFCLYWLWRLRLGELEVLPRFRKQIDKK